MITSEQTIAIKLNYIKLEKIIKVNFNSNAVNTSKLQKRHSWSKFSTLALFYSQNMNKDFCFVKWNTYNYIV